MIMGILNKALLFWLGYVWARAVFWGLAEIFRRRSYVRIIRVAMAAAAVSLAIASARSEEVMCVFTYGFMAVAMLRTLIESATDDFRENMDPLPSCAVADHSAVGAIETSVGVRP